MRSIARDAEAALLTNGSRSFNYPHEPPKKCDQFACARLASGAEAISPCRLNQAQRQVRFLLQSESTRPELVFEQRKLCGKGTWAQLQSGLWVKACLFKAPTR